MRICVSKLSEDKYFGNANRQYFLIFKSSWDDSKTERSQSRWKENEPKNLCQEPNDVHTTNQRRDIATEYENNGDLLVDIRY